jgi:hypothetical protein
LEGEVEVLDGLAGWEPCRFDAEFPGVGLTSGNLAFEAGGEELFVGPFFLSGPFCQPPETPGPLRGL